jgi:hypothetical protein
MQPLSTVILHHVTPQDSHYDWLIQPPAHAALPDQKLWTARIGLPPEHWPENERLPLTPIAPHRPLYLTYEGPISSNRGHVTRVASGLYTPRLWTDHEILLDIHWQTPALVHRVHLHLTDEPWFIIVTRLQLA